MAQADTSESTELWGGFIDMPQQHVMQITLFGAVLGAVAWVVALFIKQVILTPLLCGNPTSAACLDISNTSANITAIIVSVVGLLGLVRLSVYRPLLIVLAILISLWGFGSWTSGMPWYQTLSWSVILYALCYLAFAWLVRPRLFAPAVALTVVAVVLIRLPSIF
jgi:hypothetical protein